jgi:hypothetical protein
MGPSKAFRPIAPNGNSTDGRQTFFRSVRFSDVYRRSPNVWRRGQTFTQRVETWSDVHPMCGDVVRRSPNVWRHSPAMIDLPTLEGTPTRSPPVGTAAAGTVMCTSLARKAWCVHIAGKKSLVCAHRWQEKLGACTSLARKAWCVHIASTARR